MWDFKKFFLFYCFTCLTKKINNDEWELENSICENKQRKKISETRELLSHPTYLFNMYYFRQRTINALNFGISRSDYIRDSQGSRFNSKLKIVQISERCLWEFQGLLRFCGIWNRVDFGASNVHLPYVGIFSDWQSIKFPFASFCGIVWISQNVTTWLTWE